MSDKKDTITDYWAVYVIQEDHRPVIICRHKETADGFVKIYDAHNIKYKIVKFPLETPFLEGRFVET